MTTKTRFSLMGLEWRLSLATIAWGVPTAVASFVLPAWAVTAAYIFEEYAPFSWVAAGFLGLATSALIFALAGWGRGKWVRARYDAKMLPKSGPIDPMAKTFERQRIYINEFALPSNPIIE